MGWGASTVGDLQVLDSLRKERVRVSMKGVLFGYRKRGRDIFLSCLKKSAYPFINSGIIHLLAEQKGHIRSFYEHKSHNQGPWERSLNQTLSTDGTCPHPLGHNCGPSIAEEKSHVSHIFPRLIPFPQTTICIRTACPETPRVHIIACC